jgi:hypothetical protein
MIVMTYTAARVKQEIAKEGILPYPKFFAQNTDLSLGRLLNWLRNKGIFPKLLRTSWLRPEHHSEKTPVGAFVLHFLSCLILIFSTWGLSPDDAYNLLTTLSVYVINCFFGVFIGLGVLILRFKGPPPSDDGDGQSTTPPKWTDLTGRRINPVLSVFCASFFTICNAWPVVTTWIRPISSLADSLPWWLVPTIAWAVIVLGIAWFLGFLAVAHNIERKHHKVFVVEKKPEFESADAGSDDNSLEGASRSGSGGLVLVHETTYMSWVGKEMLHAQGMGDFSIETTEEEKHGMPAAQYAGTDFDGYFRGLEQQHQQSQPSPPVRQNQFQGNQGLQQSLFQEPQSYGVPQQPPRSHSGNYRS